MAQRLFPLCSLLLIVSSCTQSVRTVRPTSRDKGALLKEARDQYKLDDEPRVKDDADAPIGAGYAVEGLEASAFKMNKRWFHGSEHDWVAAIKTNVRDRYLGLGAGMNYIFRLPTSDPDRELVVVPEDPDMPARYLKYNRYLDLTGGHRGPPLVIRKIFRVGGRADALAIGACIECSIGHCSTFEAGEQY